MSEKYFAQPSTLQSHFSAVPAAEIERSTFDRSHGHKTTFDAGDLVPIFWDEVLPGDTFNLSSTAFVRLATPLKPFMDNLYLDTHYFFVPYRLVWSHWEEFMGERKRPSDDPTIFTIPQTTIDLKTNVHWKLASHFGIPMLPAAAAATPVGVSALPFRAYLKIWDDWYRDENLQDPADVSDGNGPDTWVAAFALAKRGKRHDYFTSALPWPQKGNSVYIPLGTTAAVKPTAGNPGPEFYTTAQPLTTHLNAGVLSGSAAVGYDGAQQPSGDRLLRWKDARLYADLTAATAVTINDLRTAFQIQRLLERDARGGTRYIEIVLSHFGVSSADLRAIRPVYLGGGTSMININPIASTIASDVPQGNLAATGTGVGKASFSQSFTEHGIIIGLCSARADLTYQQGVEKFWSRLTRYDFYWPALAHLGEQVIRYKELLTTGTAYDDAAFGFQERYAEYRYKPSRITGKFLSADPESLDVWHLSQDFASVALNSAFITEAPPIARVIAVPTEPHFLADIWFNLKCTRPMPVYSVPGLIDHF